MSVRVLYIGGAPRSGSTLMAAMVGQLAGGAFVGEVEKIWARCRSREILCGCGALVAECPFWTRVGEVGFGGWSSVDLDEVLRLQRSVLRYSALPALAQPRLAARVQRRVRRYSEYQGRLYPAIAEAAGATVVVDSSKGPLYALLLRRVETVELRVVHLVRDPRGVAFSNRRERPQANYPAAVPYPSGVSVAKAAAAWSVWNGLFGLLVARRTPRLLVAYESFVDDPVAWLARLADFAGLPLEGSTQWLHGDEFELRPTHSIGGNPLRFLPGPTRLGRDDEWRHAMRAGDRLVAEALTFPLRRRYGYRRRS